MKKYDGKPADPETRAKGLEQMKENLRRQHEERLAECERSRLSDIEYQKRWEETYQAMQLDDIIDIPGRQDGKDIVLRFHERGGRLIEVQD